MESISNCHYSNNLNKILHLALTNKVVLTTTYKIMKNVDMVAKRLSEVSDWIFINGAHIMIGHNKIVNVSICELSGQFT